LATSSGGDEKSQLEPAQVKAMGLLAEYIKTGKVSQDVGELIAADLGRSGATALCVYFGAEPSLAYSLCGGIGEEIGKRLWPYIKKGGQALGRLALRGGSYAYEKSKELVSSMGKGILERIKGLPNAVMGNVSGYIDCVKGKKDPFSCALQVGVNIAVGDVTGAVAELGKGVVDVGRNAACSTVGLFCKKQSPQPPPPAGPSLPPEPSLQGRTLPEYMADLVVYMKQYAHLLSPDKLVDLEAQLQGVMATPIAFCSSVAWAKLPKDVSKVCDERVMLMVKNGVKTILSDPASVDRTYAMEAVKAVRFGIAMDAVEFVLASQADLATILGILFLLSNKQDQAIPSDVGEALFLSQIASLLKVGSLSPEKSFRLLGNNDAARMIWYGLLGSVNSGQMSSVQAGQEAVDLLLQLMAEHMPRKDLRTTVARMVVDRVVSPEEVEGSVAEGLSKGCKGSDCKEKAIEESRAIVTQADAIVAEADKAFAAKAFKELSGTDLGNTTLRDITAANALTDTAVEDTALADKSSDKSSSKEGLPWWGWLLIGVGVVGGGAAVYRTSKGLPILPANWSKPLS
jgi:hypothetical protein